MVEMKPFLFGALGVLSGLILFMVGVFGIDFLFLKTGWGPSLTGGAIPLRHYLVPSAYRFVFVVLAALLVIRLARSLPVAYVSVIVLGSLILLLEIGGQLELKDRVPILWKVVSLISLVIAVALGAALGTYSAGDVNPAIR